MRPVQKVLTTMLWACAVLAMVSVIGANLWRGRAAAQHGGAGVYGTEPGSAEPAAAAEQDGEGAGADPPLRVSRDVPAFSLVDQNDAPVTLETLKGKPFIANFVFTNCGGPCPQMTKKMAELQKTVPAGVKLVSFSVDAGYDRPEVLKAYAARYGADPARWHFLTTANPDEATATHTLARGMMLGAQPADGDSPIVHSEKFVLVDASGVARAYYSSRSGKQMAQLATDAAELLAVTAGTKQ